jgi:glycosyltransferase involved in cell wall biosynthesis
LLNALNARIDNDSFKEAGNKNTIFIIKQFVIQSISYYHIFLLRYSDLTHVRIYLLMTEHLIFISAHLPSQHVPEAGQKIAHKNLLDYSSQYHVHLISFVNEIERPFAKASEFGFCDTVDFIYVDNTTRLEAVLTNPFLPIDTAMRVSKKASKLIKNQITLFNPVLVHLEYTATAYYLPLFKKVPSVVLLEHDITFQRIERKARNSRGLRSLLTGIEARRQRSWEKKKLMEVKEIWVLSKKDKDIVCSLGVDPKGVLLKQVSIDPKFKKIDRSKVQKGSMLFWGALNRKENEDAAIWFIEKILPEIVHKIPEAKLYVVGANPSLTLLSKASNHIVITGFVKDPTEYFERASISVAPLREGAGVKLKVLESLTAGLVTIATPIGSEGIEHPLLRVAKTADSFAAQVCNALLENN